MLKFAAAQVLSAHTGRDGLARTAHRADFSHHSVRPGFLYVRNRAISSRTNENHDTFPAEELAKSWQTFIGRPVFVNHSNDNHRRARGVVIDAALHTDRHPDGGPDTWIEVLMEIDAKGFPKLARAILNGEIDKTSMGCDVDESECSACGNKATTPAEYCAHIPGRKGMKMRKRSATGGVEDVLIHEICRGLRFFENSLLVEAPADPTAHLLGIDATGLDKTAASSAATVAPMSAEAAWGNDGAAAPRKGAPGAEDLRKSDLFTPAAKFLPYLPQPERFLRHMWNQSTSLQIGHAPDGEPTLSRAPGAFKDRARAQIRKDWTRDTGLPNECAHTGCPPWECRDNPGAHTCAQCGKPFLRPPHGHPKSGSPYLPCFHHTWESSAHPDPVYEDNPQAFQDHHRGCHDGPPAPPAKQQPLESCTTCSHPVPLVEAFLGHPTNCPDLFGHHSYCCPAKGAEDDTTGSAHTAAYGPGPHCSRCHHIAGTGPGCPKCQATKTLQGAVGDLDLDGDGHDMAWQYRDAGPTLHGTCRNCARTSEPGAPGMRSDNTFQHPAHAEPCPAVPGYRIPDAPNRLTRTLEHLPDLPELPQHLNTKTAGMAADNDWDAIYPGIGDIHRGVNVFLHPEDHDIVHDKTLPTGQRAAHLMGSLSRTLSGPYHRADKGHHGQHWTTDPAIAEESADNGSRVYQHQRVATAVVFHAHKPNREDIEQDPQQNIIYDYGHREREVPLREGAPVRLKGVSWKSLEDEFDGEGHVDLDPEFTHHDFGHPGHHITAARATLTSVFARSAEEYLECDRGHTHWGSNGAAGLLIVHHHPDHGPQCLLGKRADWVQHGGTWSTPGGAIHDGEDPEDAAHREAGEELGRLPHLEHVHTHVDDHGGWKYHTVIARTDHPFTPDDEDGDSENDGYGWFTPDQFKDLDLHPGFAASWPHVAPHTRRAPKTAARSNWWDAYGTQASLRNTGAVEGDGDYKFLHTAPGPEDVPLHRLLHPSQKQTLRSLENGRPADEETGNAIEAANGRPRARVKIYRAAPAGVTTFNPGDWVALSSHFARDFAEGRPNHHVLTTTADARHLHTDGNDALEWGYNGPAKDGKIHWRRQVRPGTPDYAGGAVQLSPEDHDFVHDSARSVAERAHRLMAAIPRYNTDTGPYVAAAMHQNKGSYTGNRSDAHYDAQDHAEQLGSGQRPTTLFMLHSQPRSQGVTGVSFAEHTPPETPIGAYTHHTWNPEDIDEETGMRRQAALTVEAMPPRHKNPADHPFFQDHPVRARHVLAHWNQATPEEKASGERWYADAHLVAKALGHSYADDDTGKAAGIISAYSPRSNWDANLHNAVRSLAEGRALGIGEGSSIMGQHARAAGRIMDGAHYNDVLKAPKTNAFAKLIHHGGTDPDTGKVQQHVVIDRHALSVAAGKRLSEQDAEGFLSSTPHYYDHVAKTYTDTAKKISKIEGRTVAPHQVQAVTWLVRRRLNREEDLAAKGGGGKGRVKMQDNSGSAWKNAHPDLLPGGLGDNMHLSRRDTLLPNPVKGAIGNSGAQRGEWFHGTSHAFDSPESNGDMEQENTGHHWNTALGAHWTSHHDVAGEIAEKGAEEHGFHDPESEPRILHARLYIANPKRYDSEFDMDREVYGHEYDSGNHPSIHDEDHLDAWEGHPQLGHEKDLRRMGMGTHSFHPWLSNHPDRYGIAQRFKQRLVDAGHDGIVYGNEFEGRGYADKHISAIAFHPGQQEVTQAHHVLDACPGPRVREEHLSRRRDARRRVEGMEERTPEEWAEHRRRRDEAGAELGKGLWDGMLEAGGFADSEHARVHRQNNDAMSLQDRFSGDDADGEHGHDGHGEPYYQIRHPHGWLGRTFDDARLHISHESDPETEIDAPHIDGARPDPHNSGSWLPHSFGHHDLHRELHEWAMLSGPDYARNHGLEHPEGHDTPSERQQGRMEGLWGKHGKDKGGRFDYDQSGEPFFETAHHPVTGFTARDNGRHVEISHTATPEEVHGWPEDAQENFVKTKDMHTPGLYKARDEWSDAHGAEFTKTDPDIVRWRQHRERNASLKTAAPDPFGLGEWHDADAREDAQKLQHQFAGGSGRVTTHPWHGAVYRATHPSGWYADYAHGSNGIDIGHAGSDEQAGEPITHDSVEFPKVHPHQVHGDFIDQVLHHWVLNHHGEYAGTPSNAEIPAYMRKHRLPAPSQQAMSDAQALEGMNFQAMIQRTAYGETKAPADVDTLRSDACAVCGNTEGWDGQDCPVCQYSAPPSIFQDPDTSVARQMDLRGLGDQTIDTAMSQGADTVPGGLDQTGQTPGAPGEDPAGAEPAGGEVEDPNDATADGDVRTLGDPQDPDSAQQLDPDAVGADTADPQGSGAPLPGGPEGAEDPGLADPAMSAEPGMDEVLTCPACGYQTPAGAPVSAVTADPAAPASAGPVAGDVCPQCGKAVLVSQAELEGAAPPPEVPVEDPEAVPQDSAAEGPPVGQPKSPAVKRVSSTAPMIDLYHRTTPQEAQKIMQDRLMRSSENPRWLYFSDRRDSANADGYGSGVVHVRVPEHLAEVDDEFGDGETHYRIMDHHLQPGHFISG